MAAVDSSMAFLAPVSVPQVQLSLPSLGTQEPPRLRGRATFRQGGQQQGGADIFTWGLAGAAAATMGCSLVRASRARRWQGASSRRTVRYQSTAPVESFSRFSASSSTTVAAAVGLARGSRAEADEDSNAVVKLEEAEGYIMDMINGKIPEDEVSGWSTGWANLDDFYRPVPGQLTIVTGTPGTGKSEFLLSLLVNLAKADPKKRFALACFETSKEDLVLQLLEKYFGMNLEGLRNVSKEQYDEGCTWVSEHFRGASPSCKETTIDQVLLKAEDCMKRPGGVHQRLAGLLIDPYNYIELPGGNRSLSETNFVSDMLTKVKTFAMKHKTHVWLVAHPVKKNQWSGGKVPSLYDIAGSAHFYNKCDNGIVLERTRDEAQARVDMLKVHVQKVRQDEAGQLGQVEMWFDPGTYSYSDERTGLGHQGLSR